MPGFAKHRQLVFFLIVIFVSLTTFFAIKFAQGYRIDLTTKSLRPSGLLVTSSTPEGAEVLLDGQLKTATNSTIALPPGEYSVEIKKSGFSSWMKKLKIEKELVTQVDAFLFPQLPDLKPLTFNEALNPQISPDSTRIVYSVGLPGREAGLWIMELTDFFFNIGREPHQIALSRTALDFSKAQYTWSPDSKQILVEPLHSNEKYLLDPNRLATEADLVDTTSQLAQIESRWQADNQLRQEAKLKRVPEKMREILSGSAENLDFSPDGSKVLYQATASAQIPEHLISPVLASSTQTEARQIEANKIYVYDLKEDKNFLLPFTPPAEPTPTTKAPLKRGLPTPTPTIAWQPESWSARGLHWLPTSRHLFWLQDEKVLACEYDGTNVTTIYSGPLIKPFVFAAPDGNRLIILTKISSGPESKTNLYSVSLK